MDDSGPVMAIALIGAGRIGADWIAAIAAEPRWRLHAIVESDAARRAELQREHAVPVFAELPALLAEESPDAAVVATPPALHEPMVQALLEHRVHVLCEKPLALTSAAAQRILLAAGRSDRRVMMASKFRYLPELAMARQLVADGEIGDPVQVVITFCADTPMAERWNAQPAISGGGVLIDHGAHAFDVARAFAGPIQRVFAHFGRRVQPLAVEDTVHVLAEARRGVLATIDMSWSTPAFTEHWCEVRGSRGTVRLGFDSGAVRRQGEAQWQRFGGRYDKRAALARQLANFAAVIAGTAAPQIGHDDALDSVRAVEAAYRSATLGRWVPLPQRENV